MKVLCSKLPQFLLMLMLVISMTGCTSQSRSEGEMNVEEQVVQETYPITLTDSFGKLVTLETEPERIISVAPSITEIIYALGAETKLVGRTDFCDYPEQVSEVESIGMISPPDIEKMISLEPDLVITSTHFNEENASTLEALGIPVIGLCEENDVDGVWTIIETLGRALNRTEEANTVIQEMQATIDEVKESVSDLEKPSVYYVVSYGEYGDYSAPENTFIGQLIDFAGGKDIVPASESWAYSLEALLEADPDIIIVRKGDKEGFMTAPGYQTLTAVQEGHVYEIDHNLIDRQSNRNAQGVLELAKIIHPEAFNN